MSVRIARPAGPLRFAFRLPLYLYNAGLGGLLDHRFMVLTHQGRKSGRTYETVLEVIVYHPPTRTSFVASGWGDKADWFRNIQVRPAIRVQVGNESYTPVQRFLNRDEVARVWRIFRRKHPIEERMALWLYSRPDRKYRSARERREDLLGRLLIVAFRPQQQEQSQHEQ